MTRLDLRQPFRTYISPRSGKHNKPHPFHGLDPFSTQACTQPLMGCMQLDAMPVETSYTFRKSDNLVARELAIVGLATHKMIAAELCVGTATPPFGREAPTACSLVTRRGLVVPTSTWLNSRRNHNLHSWKSCSMLAQEACRHHRQQRRHQS